MKRQYTIVVDTREQKNRLLFPAHIDTLNPLLRPDTQSSSRVQLDTVRQRISDGDYHLLEHPHRMVIEAKGSIDEIATNCGVPHRRKRFIEELDTLRARCLYPVLLLRGKPHAYLTPTQHTQHPGCALSSLLQLLLQRNIWLIWAEYDTIAQRRACGELVAHLLITASHTRPLRPESR